ncbi:TonB-dependent siderophore receptor [Comamonas sp. GB3 AK4-5]|uniref:TonB-dependent siderophore receptor n=1 Tax=Comamonas sp. GB3 AK4-5 TaxID=3231487 RepID=UPI00351DC524
MARPFFHLHPATPRHALALAARCALIAMACTAGTGQAQTLAASAAAQAETMQNYQIALGALDEALASFAVRAGISITMPPALVQGKTSPGLQGRYGLRDGLAGLLAGTGLEAVAGSGGVYTLRALPVVVPGAAAGPGAMLGEVKVTAEAGRSMPTEGSGRYIARSSESATKLDLALQKTPQSITVITRQQMDDQGLQGIADVLRQTPGIAVNRDNTEGYSFYARGFQVENFQFDGVPSLSSAGGNVRDNYSLTDSAIYDRVEILKGATGLVNGVGDPSGVINLVRKRPTADFQGHASVDVGSWDDYRSEVDLSSPLSADGRIRGRLVAAAQDSRSFIDYLKTRKSLLYGIVEADLAASTTLSLGFNIQQNKGQGTTNSHLPAFFSDGTVARFSRSTNAADRWAHRDQDTQHLFATLEHELGSGWNLKAHLGRRTYQSREVISGISSATIDATTHSVDHGFYAGGASQFNTDTTEDSMDLQLSGKYALGGRDHKLVLGYGSARTKAVSNRSDGDTDALIPDVFHWDNNASQPTAYEWWSRFDVNARQKIAYAATVLQPSDRLSLILGGRVTDYAWSLASINALGRSSYASTKIHGKFIPYAGVTLDVDGQHTVYASYTDVFKPQAYNYDAQDRQLNPLTGKSYELGIKGSYLENKLNASAALFQLKQDNYAINDPSGATRPDGGVASVAIQGVTTKGVELEVFGELQPGWQLGAGITYIQPRDAYGKRVSANQPEKTFKLATMYRLPGTWKHVSVGGNVQWQSGTYFTQQIAGADRRFSQPAYTVVGLVAGVQLSRQLKATFSVDNLFDKYYYAGIGNYNSVFWGAPRSFKANLRYVF